MSMTNQPDDVKREWVGGTGESRVTISKGDKLGKYSKTEGSIHKFRTGHVDIGEATESVMPDTPMEEHEHRRWRAKREEWTPPPGTEKVKYT
jgi:hypothetical protein